MYLGVDVLITLLQNIMAYEVIILYHLHMPFLLSFFCIFYYTFIGQDIKSRKKSADLF